MGELAKDDRAGHTLVSDMSGVLDEEARTRPPRWYVERLDMTIADIPLPEQKLDEQRTHERHVVRVRFIPGIVVHYGRVGISH